MANTDPIYTGVVIELALIAVAYPVVAVLRYRHYAHRLVGTPYMARFKIGWLVQFTGWEIMVIGAIAVLALGALNAHWDPFSAQWSGLTLALLALVLGSVPLVLAGIVLTDDAHSYLWRTRAKRRT